MTVYGKIQEERNDWKMDLFFKKEAEHKDLENSQFILWFSIKHEGCGQTSVSHGDYQQPSEQKAKLASQTTEEGP